MLWLRLIHVSIREIKVHFGDTIGVYMALFVLHTSPGNPIVNQMYLSCQQFSIWSMTRPGYRFVHG